MLAADANWHRHDLVVVGGDFNTVTDRGIRALGRTLRQAGLERVSMAPSYRRGGRDLMLDHVFARGFTGATSGVVAGTTASDHAPVWVELDPPRDGDLEDDADTGCRRRHRRRFR